MTDRFQEVAGPWIIRTEGGHTVRPSKDDPGGETKYGICKRSYPGLDIANLTVAHALSIYRRDFWRPKAAQLPPPLDLVFFDMCVHHGQGNATRILQAAAGLKPDGSWGDQTSGGVQHIADIHQFCDKVLDQRMTFMRKLKNWEANKNGWANRVKDLRKLIGETSV